MPETKFSEEEIQARLKDLPGWELRDGWIRRTFKTQGWPHTLLLVNAIGFRAEAAFHHPDLSVGWGQVVVKLQTHSAGGITNKDFALARDIESLALWQPPEGAPLEGWSKGNKGKKWIH